MDSYASSSPPVRREPSENSYRLPLLLLVLLILAGVAFLPTYLEQVKYKQTRGEIAAIRESLPELKLGSLGRLFTMVGRTVSPSVVHIETEQPVMTRSQLFSQQQGQASGVIVDTDGHIVTNSHVIQNADRDNIRVKLADGRTRTATVVGDDPKNDLAVLKIEADHLTPAPWGDSDALAVGELVWAIGNPFGLDNSLTFGIVSAKDRRGLSAESRYNEFLQTDAAVNPGNSGGPLVNMSGEVVGINTAIVGPTFQGISFAIPSNVARRIYRQIRDEGGVVTGYLGVQTLPLRGEVARQLGVEPAEGALVVGVGRGTPAEKAGIEPLDFITAWDGEKVQDPQQLGYFVGRTAPGTTATVTLQREGEEIEVEVTVGHQPQADAKPRG